MNCAHTTRATIALILLVSAARADDPAKSTKPGSSTITITESESSGDGSSRRETTITRSRSSSRSSSSGKQSPKSGKARFKPGDKVFVDWGEGLPGTVLEVKKDDREPVRELLQPPRHWWVLLRGTIPGEPTEDVAWIREYKGGRIFYTSLGSEETFQQPGFRRMLANALFWTTAPRRRKETSSSSSLTDTVFD